MRSPSSRVLSDVVDWYAGTTTQDADGAVQFSYPAIPTRKAIPCSAQAGDVEEVLDDQDRLTQMRTWKLFVANPTGAKARDKFTIIDGRGIAHTLLARVERDEGGRGSTFVVHCVERI